MRSISCLLGELASIANERGSRRSRWLGLALAGVLLTPCAARSEIVTASGSAFFDPSFVLTAGRLNLEHFRLLGPAGLDQSALTVTATDDASSSFIEVTIPDGYFQLDTNIDSLLERITFDLFVTGGAISQVTLSMVGSVAGNASAYADFELLEYPYTPGPPRTSLGALSVQRDTLFPDVLTDSLNMNGQGFTADGSIQVVTYADNSYSTVGQFRFDLNYVPEPSTAALAILGAVAAALFACVSRRRAGSAGR